MSAANKSDQTLIIMMLQSTARHCALEYDEEPSPLRIRESILQGEDCHSEFFLLTAPLPARDPTVFQVRGNRHELLVGIALFDSLQLPNARETESVEILFDPHCDGIGWFQFVIPLSGSAASFSFLPYPAAHSSAYPQVQLQKYEVCEEAFSEYSRQRCTWVYAWFRTDEIFRYGDVCGFNICRSRPGIEENSSWNFCSGNGFPDATSFGRLHREALPAAGGETTEEGTGGESGRRVSAGPMPTDRDFQLSLTYDIPDNLLGSDYTPERMREEFEIVKGWGISRLHWIDYSHFSAFWRVFAADNYQRSVEHCDDLLGTAVQQASACGLELFVDFKVFDWGFNDMDLAVLQPMPETVPDLENRYFPVIPEISNHPEWTMQSNPDWRAPSGQARICTLRFFSRTAIPNLDVRSVQLWVSDDNVEYSPAAQAPTVRQGSVQRPHARWTPERKIPESGSEPNWFIELSGFEIQASYLAVTIDAPEFQLSHQGFMVMEAEDPDGNELACTIATSKREGSYVFWKGWPTWNNNSEPLLQHRSWNGNDLGVTFRAMPNMPTMLEPAYDGTREVWLKRIEEIFSKGADGVSIRTLCHHNAPMSYLQYAFAPIVVERFLGLFGRRPQGTPEDYERSRRIRGEAFTQFLREAKDLALRQGKKLALQLEYGIEVPPHMDTRMQIFWDYRTWIDEGLMDEIHLKFWTAYSPFVHEGILPLARAKGIPVHIIGRNGANLEVRCMETIERLVADAYRSGFSGYNFYEAFDILQRLPGSPPRALGHIEAAIKKAAAYVSECCP